MESGSRDPQPDHVNWVLGEAPAPGSPEPRPPAPATVPATPRHLAFTTLGAAGGSAFGAFVWFLLEYFVHFQIGYAAVLCGWLAGLGAIRIGNVRGTTVGVIAAVAGGLGVLIGSYAAFQANMGKDDSQLLTVPGLSTDLTPGAPADADQAELEADPSADDPLLAQPADDYTIFDFYADYPGELAWILVFGIIGVGAGFAVGSASED